MVKRFIAVILIALAAFSCAIPAAAAYEPTTFDITAKSSLLVSLDNGDVLYSKNPDERVYPASITKIMTAVVAIENIDDLENTMMTTSQHAIDVLYGTDSSVFGLKPGEQLSAKDMLYVMLIHSANESANVIAEHIAGSIDGFVALMNKKAEELGMTNTHYMNPHGLHDENHYTTANDLYKLVTYAMKLPLFMEICTCASYTVPPTNMNSNSRTIASTNLLMLPSSGYYYQYASGIKTGYTDPAGRCLISTASKDGYSYLSIVMGCPVKDASGKMIRDDMTLTANLFKWAFSNFKYRRIISTTDPISEIKIENAWDTDYVQLFAQQDCYAIIPADADISTITTKISLTADSVSAPVQQGDVLGSCEFYLAEEKIAEVPLIAGSSVDRSMVLYVLSGIKDISALTWFRVIVIIILILILIIITLRTIQRSRQRQAQRLARQRERQREQQRQRQQEQTRRRRY